MLYWNPRIMLGKAGLLMIFICAIMVVSIGGQTRTHNLGEYQLTIYGGDNLNTNDTDGIATGEWPQDHYRYGTIVFYNSGFVVGKWIDDQAAEHLKEDFLDPVSYNDDDPYGIVDYRRAEPPVVYVETEGQMLLSSRSFGGVVDPTLPSDQMIELRYKAEPGFDVTKRSYSYTNDDHDDYVIHVITYETTFDWDEDDDVDTDATQTLEDVYFVIGYSFQTAEGTRMTYSRWFEEAQDDWASYDVAASSLVTGGRDLVYSYGWDGDHPEIEEFETGGGPFDDTGDPRFVTGGDTPLTSGEFVSNAYAGFAALHVDTAPGNTADDVSQPTSIIGNISIYNVWDSDFYPYATVYDWANSGDRQTVEEQAGWPDDPMDQEAEFPFQSFGPYDMALGDEVTIVYVVGANGISRELSIAKGLEWRDWYRGVAGADFDDDAKNTLLAEGQDSLVQTFDRALWAWDNDLDIPDPLPAPDLTVISGPLRIDLEWSDLSAVPDPDSDTPDLDYYVIYRKRGEFLVDTYNELDDSGEHLLWAAIDTVAGNVTEYSDTDVVRGEPYHYAVTAVDDQGLESSIYANRSEIAAYAFEPGADDAKGVRIVPNPYIVRSQDFNFTGDDNRLLFVNLPPYCTLRIYTATGDLIKVINHTSGSADESWDQVTESNQLVSSGVYILRVEDASDLDNNSLAGTIEKFVIVR